MTNPNSISLSRRKLLIGLAAVAIPVGSGSVVAAREKPDRQQTSALDVLVVAPHSDDEAIGCTGVMLRAIAKKERIGVVIVTAGDGFPKAAAAAAKKEPSDLTADDFVSLAALRQRHSLQAMERIGLEADDLMFLGYPDGGLDKLYAAQDEIPYRQPFTGKTATYGPVALDYHNQVYGCPAPYVRKSVLGDLAEIIEARKPKEIYCTGQSDTHGDHRATFWFVRDAAKAAAYRGTLWTYVVHGSPPAESPQRRLALSESEQKTKRATIEGYQFGVSPVHDRLADTYAKPEELFWEIRLEAEPKKQ